MPLGHRRGLFVHNWLQLLIPFSIIDTNDVVKRGHLSQEGTWIKKGKVGIINQSADLAI